MGLFGYVSLLVPMTKHACRMALASNIQEYTFKIALWPCKQCFITFSEGLRYLADLIFRQLEAWLELVSGSELGADLSAWLVQIMARLTAKCRTIGQG